MSARPPVRIYEPPAIPRGRPVTSAAPNACGPVGLRRRARRRPSSRRQRLSELFAEKRALEARLEHVLTEIAKARGERL